MKGIIDFEEYSPVAGVANKGIGYRVKSKESSYRDNIDDDKFVTNYEACKSGFALYFYPDKSAKDTYTDNSNPNKIYLMLLL